MNKPDFKKIAMKVVGVGVGVAAGKGIDKVPFIGNLNGYIKGAAKIGLAQVVLPMFVKSKPDGLVDSIATGVTAVGLLDIAEKALPSIFGSVAGVGDAAIEGVGNAYIEEDHTPLSGYESKVYGTESAMV